MPSKSFWEESYDLPHWFTVETSAADKPAPPNLPSSPSSRISTDQVDSSASLAVPALPMLNSSDNDAATRVQVITAMPPITLDEIRVAQAEDDNLLPVIQALLD